LRLENIKVQRRKTTPRRLVEDAIRRLEQNQHHADPQTYNLLLQATAIWQRIERLMLIGEQLQWPVRPPLTRSNDDAA
jgi:hypothetical protein